MLVSAMVAFLVIFFRGSSDAGVPTEQIIGALALLALARVIGLADRAQMTRVLFRARFRRGLRA